MYDAIVIGAGPSGLSISKDLLENGLDVLILEEHSEVGIPRHCTGVVSSSLIKLVGPSAEKSIINKIKSAKFISSNGSFFKISFDKSETFILDRVFFEQLLLEEVIGKGGTVLFNKRVKRISFHDSNLEVATNDHVYHSRFVICACGAYTSLLDSFGYNSPNSFPSIQYEIEGEVNEEEEVELVFTKEAKGFFLWKAPTSENSFLIGLGIKEGNPKKNLDAYIQKNKIFGKIKAVYSGRIIFDQPVKNPIFKDKIIAIGDLAGHSKPTTGGGLFYGILGSKIAGQFISTYLKGYDRQSLQKLVSMQERYINEELRKTYSYAKFFYNFPYHFYDILFKGLNKVSLSSYITPEDQDHHIKVITDLIANPRLLLKICSSLLLDTISLKVILRNNMNDITCQA